MTKKPPTTELILEKLAENTALKLDVHSVVREGFNRALTSLEKLEKQNAQTKY